jgi:thiamine biosynthesis lipoprotein
VTAERRASPAYVELVPTMGTVISLDVRAATRPPTLTVAFADATRRLQEIDAQLSAWQGGSWVSRLLDDRVTLSDSPEDVRATVGLAEKLRSWTDGYFSAYWRGNGAGPDPTGLVKGWAAQQASDVLASHGLRDHVVNAAGDLVVSGSPAPGSPESAVWRLGITEPTIPGALAGIVELAPGAGRWAMATSGLAEHRRHVLDPHTGRYPGSVASATAVAWAPAEPTAPVMVEVGALTDACATALVAAGHAAPDLLRRLAVHGVHGLLIHADGRVNDPEGLLTRDGPVSSRAESPAQP